MIFRPGMVGLRGQDHRVQAGGLPGLADGPRVNRCQVSSTVAGTTVTLEGLAVSLMLTRRAKAEGYPAWLMGHGAAAAAQRPGGQDFGTSRLGSLYF
jgi:hypothetical protein